MKAAIFGTWHLGLVVGAALAETGNQVWCVDTDPRRIRLLQRGYLSFYEPQLQELVTRNQKEERLWFTTDLVEAVDQASVIFIAVGSETTATWSTGQRPDVNQAAAMIGRAMTAATNKPVGFGPTRNLPDGTRARVIVNVSTAPVGTADRIRRIMSRETQLPFTVIANPQFINQGTAIEGFMRPDRVVLGTNDPDAVETMRELYAPFTRTGARVLTMDAASAEMCKHATNAMLACRISFINEIANLCEIVGADVNDVRLALGADRRIGPSFLSPGLGYGGFLSTDNEAFTRFAHEFGCNLRLIEASEQVNVEQRQRFIDKIFAVLSAFADRPRITSEYSCRPLEGRTVALWGVSFKPRTDAICEAPGVAIIEQLLNGGACVHVYDPHLSRDARARFGSRVRIAMNQYAVLDGADALALITEWNEFREPDFEKMAKMMRHRVIFDGRNLFRRGQVERYGFSYVGTGTPAAHPLLAVTAGLG
jgi:UDPglucose 6-dehydrogenase